MIIVSGRSLRRTVISMLSPTRYMWISLVASLAFRIDRSPIVMMMSPAFRPAAAAGPPDGFVRLTPVRLKM